MQRPELGLVIGDQGYTQTLQRVSATSRSTELIAQGTKEQLRHILLVGPNLTSLVEEQRLTSISSPVLEDALGELGHTHRRRGLNQYSANSRS